MSNRTELAYLARNLRRYLENQRSIGAVGLSPASPDDRAAYERVRASRRALEMERARAQLMGPALGGAGSSATPERGAPAPRPAAGRAPEAAASRAPAQPAPVADAVSQVLEGNPMARAAEALGATTKRQSAPPPSSGGDGGAIWKQLGARPTRLFNEKTAAPPENPRNRVPDKPKPANGAATPRLFTDLEPAKGGVRVKPLLGYDATPDQVKKLSELDAAAKLEFLRECLGDCSRCKLHTGRTNIVFGDGSPTADLVFVGEGPGFNEDRQGVPFVGKAGGLLNKMISAMGIDRTDTYIVNVVKCRPPNNRDPERDEIDACSPFLFKQLETLDPKVIITLGRFASQTLLDTKDSMGRMRGKWRDWRGVKVMPTYHPAYLLRSPEQKRKAWSDLQMVMAELGLS